MLFWLFVIFLVIGVALLFLYNHYFNREVREKYPVLKCFYKFYLKDSVFISGAISTFIAVIGIVISLIVFIGNYSDTDAYVEKNNARYECLCYKLESEKTRDKFGLVNKEIVDEIQDWNEDVVYYQTIQDNFWVGIYYPNIFDQFEKIELK